MLWRKHGIFEISHDSDGDGIYENIAGSGWVESWIPKMPHQEIYLAALDQQASTAFANIAKATGHAQMVDDVEKRATHIAQQIEKEYYLPNPRFLCFQSKCRRKPRHQPHDIPGRGGLGRDL